MSLHSFQTVTITQIKATEWSETQLAMMRRPVLHWQQQPRKDEIAFTMLFHVPPDATKTKPCGALSSFGLLTKCG